MTQVVKPARKAQDTTAVSLRMDRKRREALKRRAERVNMTVQHMLTALIEDLLTGRSCFINPLGQVFVRDPEGGKPRRVMDAAGPVAPLREAGTAPRS